MKKQKAFSLIEMSIVSIIIGIIIAGIMQGSGMIKTARLSNARSFTSKSIVPEISGLVAWYETSLLDSFTSGQNYDGVTVTTWYNISPESMVGSVRKNTLTSSGSDITYLASGINQNPSLKFSGSQYMTLSDFYQGSLAQSTIFLVVRPLNAPSSTAQTIIDSYSTGATSSIGIKSTAVNLDLGTSVDASISSNSPTSAFVISSDYIIGVYSNSTSSQIFVNNAATGVSAGSAGSNSLTGLTIGTNKSFSSAFGGLISEIIIYNRPLKIQERKDVMTYLSKKYKIAVTGI